MFGTRHGSVPETPQGAVEPGEAQKAVDRMVAGLGGTARAVERVLARTEGRWVGGLRIRLERVRRVRRPVALQSVSLNVESKLVLWL